MSRFFDILIWIVFSGLAVILIGLLSWDFRPSPIYGALLVKPEVEYPKEFDEGEWFEIDFAATARNLNGIYWLGLLPNRQLQLEARLDNRTTDEVIYHGITTDAESLTKFEGNNDVGDDLRLSFRWAPEEAPIVLAAADDGTPLFRVSANKEGSGAEWRSEPTPGDEWDELALEPNKPLITHFEAAEAGLRAIYFPGMRRDPISRVDLFMFNETRGTELKKAKWTGAEEPIKILQPGNEIGDRIRVELKWRPFEPRPNLQQSYFPPAEKMEVRIGGEETDFTPIFKAEYAWPTRQLQWLWPLVVIAFGIAIWRTNRWSKAAFLVVLGLLCVLTSLMFWQQRYGIAAMHTDPDRYARYGQFLHDYVTDAEKRDEIAANPEFRDYPHAYVATVPVTLAALYTFLPKDVAYTTLVAFCSFGVLILLGHIGRRVFELTDRQLLIGLSMLAMHVVFLKAFARPSSDMPGLLAIVAMIAMLLWRLREETRHQIWLAALLGIALVFVRPSAPLYLFFFGVGFVIVDWIREQKINVLKRVIVGFAVAGPATALFFLAFWYFGWSHNLNLAFEKKQSFHNVTTFDAFAVCLPALLQLLPLLWIRGGFRNPLERKSAYLILAWLGFYLLMILLTKAPFLTRLFLPMVPFFVLFAMLGLRDLKSRLSRAVAYSLIAVSIAANVGATIYLTTLPHLPPQPFARFIY